MAVVGHQKIINFLEKSVEKDRIFQAYLFCGPKNVGKFTVAFDFAKKLTGADKEANPDIIVISPEDVEKDEKKKEGEIKIEKIRELEHELGLTSYFGKYKVAIIDGADRMNVSAQNSILKILEEPPKNCILLLVCHDASKIIPTIKSRCVIKRFSLVDRKEIASLVLDHENSEEIAFWSFGRPGLAKILKENGQEMEKRKKGKYDLKKIFDLNLSEKFDFCENLSKEPREALEKLEIWMSVLREEILGKENFLSISKNKSLGILEEIQKSLDIIKNTNSNLRLVLENLILKF